MNYTKEEVETRLEEALYEMLEGFNQEDSIISVDYDPTNQSCLVKLKVHIVEQDDYIGFSAY